MESKLTYKFTEDEIRVIVDLMAKGQCYANPKYAERLGVDVDQIYSCLTLDNSIAQDKG